MLLRMSLRLRGARCELPSSSSRARSRGSTSGAIVRQASASSVASSWKQARTSSHRTDPLRCPPDPGLRRHYMVVAATAPELVTDDAARRLIATAKGRGFALAFDLLADRSEAEDAVQDALVKALAWASRLRDPEALEAWFLRTLANGCIRTLRRRRVVRAFAAIIGRRG